MPFGMEDCSLLPRLTDALLKRGYAERDVKKILGATCSGCWNRPNG
jgi:microsomal dipeptidase-like Zn-dependent dipeptidase